MNFPGESPLLQTSDCQIKWEWNTEEEQIRNTPGCQKKHKSRNICVKKKTGVGSGTHSHSPHSATGQRKAARRTTRVFPSQSPRRGAHSTAASAEETGPADLNPTHWGAGSRNALPVRHRNLPENGPFRASGSFAPQCLGRVPKCCWPPLGWGRIRVLGCWSRGRKMRWLGVEART